MRQVKKKAKKNSGGILQRTGAHLDDWFQRAISVVITYTSVAVAGVCILALLMLFAGGYFFNIGGRVATASSDVTKAIGFEVSRVTLKGARNINEREIMAALAHEEFGPVMGRSLLYFDANSARLQLESLGWVKHAAVSRLWPKTVHVSIEERVPAALWQQPSQGLLYLIDEDGAVITRVGGDEYAGLPVILGSSQPTDARAIMTALAAYPKMQTRIVALRLQGGRRWDLKFSNGFSAMLPESGYEIELAKLAKMNAGDGPLGEKIEQMDLRDPEKIRLKEKPATVVN